MKINTRENAAQRSQIMDAFVLACVVGKNLKTPNLSPLADDAITRGSIQSLGSPLYICETLTDGVWP